MSQNEDTRNDESPPLTRGDELAKKALDAIQHPKPLYPREDAVPPKQAQGRPKPDDPKRCKAKTRNGPREGARCGNWSIQGREYCKYHGGWLPIKAKHGLRSKYRAELVKEKIDRFAEDPEIKSLRSEVAVLRGLMELTLEKCQDTSDVISSGDSLIRISDTISKVLKRMVEIEEGLKVSLHITQLEMVIGQVIHVINSEVKDDDVREKLAHGISNLTLHDQKMIDIMKSQS